MEEKKSFWNNRFVKMTILCLIGIFINLAGSFLVSHFSWPLYFDSIGTILIAVMSGYLPGIIVGLFTNLIKGIFNTPDVYYAVVNVLIAVVAAVFARREWIKKIWGVLLLILCLGILGGGHGALLNRMIEEPLSGPAFFGNGIVSAFIRDFIDKGISVILVVILSSILPQAQMRLEGWQQAPLNRKQLEDAKKSKNRKGSIRTKLLWLLVMAGICAGLASLIISIILYRNYTIDEHIRLAKGTATLVANLIDGDKVNQYIEEGDSSEEYKNLEARLYNVRNSSTDIEYVYVYKIMKDGCHVVFDLDTEELEGGNPGEIIEFDESFSELIPTLLSGGEIEPIITNDTYGWLITAYVPVYDSNGKCACYAAADVSMNLIRENMISFMIKLISIFAGFFILVLALGMWISEYNIVLPINSMSVSASEFDYTSVEDLFANEEKLERLRIRTGDEIETVYNAFTKTTENTVAYVQDLNKKTETISKMQTALIFVLADMVENRDENTGDHVRKTAEYTRIIMDKMRELGYYKDQLTDQFVYNVEHSAPLHDIGKITISDMILNKPDKLSDKEFQKMKTHTTAGAEVLSKVIDTVPESGYLIEAKNLAEFHHEKWNGKGYPYGLAGEDIPLSARIMAVADVFDALVSDRVYKKAFSFEKAMSIIREEAGTSFDPLVAGAFLESQERVREVMRIFKERSDQKATLQKEKEESRAETAAGEKKEEVAATAPEKKDE